MKKSTRLSPLVLTALIAACASTQEPNSADQGTQSPTAATTPAPSARGVERSGPSASTPGSTAVTTQRAGAPDQSSVYFDYDHDEIKPQFRGVIEDHAKFLRQNPAIHARIEGNADERGSREYNVALGQRRAEAVMKALSLLGVPADLLAEKGAVCTEVAEAMASGALARTPADAAIAITGVAGPGGGSVEKPVGTVWIALVSAERIETKRLSLWGDRDEIRRNVFSKNHSRSTRPAARRADRHRQKTRDRAVVSRPT